MTTAGEMGQAVGSCWECGYALRGLESRRCPECGRAFDPGDPATMNMGRAVGGWAQRLMRPPGWPMYALVVVAVVVSVWGAEKSRWGPGRWVDDFSELLLLGPQLWWGRHRSMWLRLGRPEGLFLLAGALWAVVLVTWGVRRVARGVAVRRVSNRAPAALAYWVRWTGVLVAFGVTVLVCLFMPGGTLHALFGR